MHHLYIVLLLKMINLYVHTKKKNAYSPYILTAFVYSSLCKAYICWKIPPS